MKHVALEKCLSGVFLATEVIVALLHLSLYFYFSLFVTVLSGHLLLVGLSCALLGQLRKERLHRFEVGLGVQQGEDRLIDRLVDFLAIVWIVDVGAIDESVYLLVG